MSSLRSWVKRPICASKLALLSPCILPSASFASCSCASAVYNFCSLIRASCYSCATALDDANSVCYFSSPISSSSSSRALRSSLTRASISSCY